MLNTVFVSSGVFYMCVIFCSMESLALDNPNAEWKEHSVSLPFGIHYGNAVVIKDRKYIAGG